MKTPKQIIAWRIALALLPFLALPLFAGYASIATFQLTTDSYNDSVLNCQNLSRGHYYEIDVSTNLSQGNWGFVENVYTPHPFNQYVFLPISEGVTNIWITNIPAFFRLVDLGTTPPPAVNSAGSNKVERSQPNSIK